MLIKINIVDDVCNLPVTVGGDFNQMPSMSLGLGIVKVYLTDH